MKIAIADPPYPPLFRERFDLVDGRSRVTARSRATRWYGDGTRSRTDAPRADLHPEASKWDDIAEHRALLLHLVEHFDGWAIATTPDGLGAYHPLPVNSQIMAWHRPTAMPGGGRLIERWEPVIVYIPEERRTRAGARVSNVLTANAHQHAVAVEASLDRSHPNGHAGYSTPSATIPPPTSSTTCSPAPAPSQTPPTECSSASSDTPRQTALAAGRRIFVLQFRRAVEVFLSPDAPRQTPGAFDVNT
ncbi:hypothetical protein [Microbacterium sp. NIBRBAC000506063]|uniref:hypothetical protein n=1 Tax=Microbacterium sp. NIBRBAC000506063 TaxID=2734618 RepID=UPI001BB7C478|nr:hypothetical protein [Microbacterium sp. NIBRBAC000506063]QTV79471.1 hypothetical protein KAE78_11245 [Microbacterium sp. NIBRBAC000506063]